MTQANTTTPPQVPASESSAGPSSNLTSSGNLYGQFAAPIRCYERVNVQSICAFCGATTSCYISLPSSCYPPAAERTWGFPLGPEYGSFIIDYAYSAYELPLRYSSLSNAEVSSSWHDDVYRFSGSAVGCLYGWTATSPDYAWCFSSTHDFVGYLPKVGVSWTVTETIIPISSAFTPTAPPPSSATLAPTSESPASLSTTLFSPIPTQTFRSSSTETTGYLTQLANSSSSNSASASGHQRLIVRGVACLASRSSTTASTHSKTIPHPTQPSGTVLPSQNEPSISAGAKAGIGVGVAVAALSILALAFQFLRRRKKRSQAAPSEMLSSVEGNPSLTDKPELAGREKRIQEMNAQREAQELPPNTKPPELATD